jgi:hypothetical protein
MEYAQGAQAYAQGALSYVMGPGLVPQILLVVVLMIAANTVISIVETIVNTLQKQSQLSTIIHNDTLTDKWTVVQNPNSEDPLIYNSANEPTGMEFSYSMWLFIDPKTFEAGRSQQCGPGKTVNTVAMKHIFHKGSKSGFPLLAPGIFVKGDTNTLRIYMNTTTAWDKYVEVPNIPIGKWFHLVITMKGKFMDVYVNGNIAVREECETVPKLNFGNIYVLTPITFPARPGAAQLGDFKVDGAAVGMVSRIKYFSFASNYSQIDSLYREGPSKTITASKNAFSQKAPYMQDDWWVTRY